MKDIISVTYDKNKQIFEFFISLPLNIIFLILITLILYQVIKILINPKKKSFELSKVQLKIGGVTSTYEVTRNDGNIEIAHKIYIELITRKAAMEIDEKNDLIVEIYNSWYELFKVTREEIKNISGKSLLTDSSSNKLIDLTIDVLNLGLRPHLTIYQAEFRRWFESTKDNEELKGLSPQMIQIQYPKWGELISSMKEVNRELIGYSKQLRILVEG